MTQETTEEQKQKELQNRISQTLLQERTNSGTSWTRNEEFDKNGYYLVENLWDPKELYCEPPEKRGLYHYFGKKEDQFNYTPTEGQVEGSTSRYWYPQYREIHSLIRIKLEKIIGRKLYNTYYYDRFYYPGQKLNYHSDRDACEISVSVHVSTNLEGPYAEWPFCIKTPDTYSDDKKTEVIEKGRTDSIVVGPGDGIIYKGCERPHWREPLKSPKRRKRDILLRRPEKDYYYHQIFFHYVLQDGIRAHCAWDRGGG